MKTAQRKSQIRILEAKLKISKSPFALKVKITKLKQELMAEERRLSFENFLAQ